MAMGAIAAMLMLHVRVGEVVRKILYNALEHGGALLNLVYA